jgi:hypothetical protein
MPRYNNHETSAVNTVLVAALPLVAISVAVPAIGYTLTGAVALGVIALIGKGVFLWWDTRFQPDNLSRRASEDAAARARQAEQTQAPERKVA